MRVALFMLVACGAQPQVADETPLDAQSADLSLGMRGIGTSRLLTVALPREAVRRMVPSFVELGSTPDFDPSTYPVVFMFGSQDVFPFEFNEIFVIVPHLKRAGDVRAYSHMPRMFIDNWLVVAGGAFYGFPKAWADVEVDGETHAAYRGDTFVLGATFRQTTEPVRARVDHYMALLADTVIQDNHGVQVCSDFVYDRDALDAWSGTGEVELGADFAAGMEAGLYASETGDHGGLRIRAPWRLSAPRACD